MTTKFSLADYDLQRDPGESDADHEARRSLFKPIDRAAEKKAGRERDEDDIKSGRRTMAEVERRNSIFSGLDRAQVKIISHDGYRPKR